MILLTPMVYWYITFSNIIYRYTYSLLNTFMTYCITSFNSMKIGWKLV